MTKPPPPDRPTVTDAAQAALQQAGYRVLERGWTSDGGQRLDLVAEAPGKALVAVRVLRPSRADIEGLARAMAKSHIRRLRQAAVAWAASHGRGYSIIQVDVIGLGRDGRPVHVKAVS